MSTTISIRLPQELEKGLEELTDLTDRTKTYLVRKAIEQYLSEYADYQIALERLRDKEDSIISGKELRQRLGI